MDTTEILVVANRTAASRELIDALRRRAASTPARFTLLVPAAPHGFAWAANMKAGGEEALLTAAVAERSMRAAGLVVAETSIGDPDPVAAVTDHLLRRSYSELVVATLPHSVAHWLRISLPQRLQRLTALPITHVVATAPTDLMWAGNGEPVAITDHVSVGRAG